jgi:hypothetical protein
MEEKENRLKLKWRSGSLTYWARSGVLIMVVAVETLRQCFNVSSRRLVLINPATALSFERARMVMTISGELVVYTAMKSPLETPLLLRNAASLLTSKLNVSYDFNPCRTRDISPVFNSP